MKIRVKRLFRYQVTATKTAEIQPGVYSVPGDIDKELARKILKFGRAEVVPEKKAPENKKRGNAPDNKAAVGKKTKRGRSARSGSDD